MLSSSRSPGAHFNPVFETARKRLENADTMYHTHQGERFVTMETIEQTFTPELIQEMITTYGHPSHTNLDQSKVDCLSLDDSRVLFAILLLARLEQYYKPLLLGGLKDDVLFDEDSFKACCDLADVSDIENDTLRASRNRVGALLYQGKRQVLSKGVVLPYVERDKKGNGSFGVIYRVEVAPGHLRGSNEVGKESNP